MSQNGKKNPLLILQKAMQEYLLALCEKDDDTRSPRLKLPFLTGWLTQDQHCSKCVPINIRAPDILEVGN